MIVIPSVDVRAGRVAFRGGESADESPRLLAARFVSEGAEELHLVDLDAAERGEPANAVLLADIARASPVPCRLAGGISSIERARDALSAGFAGVLFSSAIFGDADELAHAAALGDRAIVELESRGGQLAPRGGDPALVARASGTPLLQAARAAEAAGIRALYVIDLGSETAPSGPPLALLALVRAAVGDGVALHTGGGVRTLDDLRALRRAGVASVVVGRALAGGLFTLADAKEAAA